MKISLLFISCMLSMELIAQKMSNKYSLYINSGYLSSLFIKESLQEQIVSKVETQHHKCIIFNVGLQMRLLKKWTIGPEFTYDHFGTKHRTVEYSNLSYMLRCVRTWKEAPKYSLYSGLSFGVRKIRRFEDETEMERKTIPAYQVDVIGVNYKLIDKLFIDINAGWGVSGIVSIGGRYFFK